MNILLVENNKKIIERINQNLSKTLYNIILVEDIKQVKIVLENSYNIDIIITSLDFPELDCMAYLELIRTLNKNIYIVVLASNDFNFSMKNLINLNIKSFIEVDFLEHQLYITLNNIHSKIRNDKLNKLFKEFSFYSETDLEGKIIEVSDSFCSLTGYTKNQLIGQKHTMLKHPNDEYIKYQELWKTIKAGDTWTGELQIDNNRNETCWYKTIIFPIVTDSGKISGYGAKRYDITAEKHLQELCIVDGLTGLYNRRHYDSIFSEEIKRAKRAKEYLVFMIIDIDKFKLYNDFYGHPQGDIVLQKVSDILKKNFKRANDFIIRLGGDEFVIITSTDNPQNMLLYAEKFRQDIEYEKIILEKSNNKILTVSIGVFISSPEYSYNENEIYSFADITLYEAKKLLGNRVVVYK